MGKFLIRASIFDKQGALLAQAENSYTKTHPIQYRFACHTDKPERIYLHAEIGALIKLKGKKAYRIFVERYTKDGKAASAKPCDVCEAAIKHWGIKYVEFTV